MQAIKTLRLMRKAMMQYGISYDVLIIGDLFGIRLILASLANLVQMNFILA